MTIPLDKLYHYIESTARDIYGDDVVIYRFYPHGSKKLEDLATLWPDSKYFTILPHVYCHDQEPLSYDHYDQQLSNRKLNKLELLRNSATGITSRLHANFRDPDDLNNLALLLHSEKRSTDLVKYQNNNFVCVYYWSHAILSLDWFRYAQHVKQQKKSTKSFLIYNRAWSSTREYRLKFLDYVLDETLQEHCQTTLNPIEPDLQIHYSQYQFQNNNWCPVKILENYFPCTVASSQSSADFNIKDYENTDIEIVLETVFDDDRLHLTEKSLRPIACEQPFIIVGSHGSLEYLQQYGFKTFDTVWDENYDTIDNPEQRLKAVVALMKQIAEWDPKTKIKKLKQARKIAKYNKKYFFSAKFQNLVCSELKQNFYTAFEFFQKNNAHDRFKDRWNTLLKYPQITDFLSNSDNHTIFSKQNVENIKKAYFLNNYLNTRKL
jgi:hypothetical protein